MWVASIEKLLIKKNLKCEFRRFMGNNTGSLAHNLLTQLQFIVYNNTICHSKAKNAKIVQYLMSSHALMEQLRSKIVHITLIWDKKKNFSKLHFSSDV